MREILRRSGINDRANNTHFRLNFLIGFRKFRIRNCSEPVLNSYASGDASHPESPDATSFTLSYALSSKCFGLF